MRVSVLLKEPVFEPFVCCCEVFRGRTGCKCNQIVLKSQSWVLPSWSYYLVLFLSLVLFSKFLSLKSFPPDLLELKILVLRYQAVDMLFWLRLLMWSFLQRKPRALLNPAPTSPTTSTPEPDTSTVPQDAATIPSSAMQAPTGKELGSFSYSDVVVCWGSWEAGINMIQNEGTLKHGGWGLKVNCLVTHSWNCFVNLQCML